MEDLFGHFSVCVTGVVEGLGKECHGKGYV